MMRIEEEGPLVRAEAPKRRIVIFADGTGNAFGGQNESNIWRLYQAMDREPGPDGVQQIARYIPGVGTSSVGVIRALDGATGFGVPANVRKLYRFLCWNWQQGDEIHLFGFSRGAFTVRTLAGMVRYQGLMPAEVAGRKVTEAEMKRNVLAAWNAYRRATAPLVQDGRLKMAPWIAGVRAARDGAGWLWRRLTGQPQHAQVLAALPDARKPPPGAGEGPRGFVRIRYMGLFDTVEAYGLPVEELRRLFSWLLWPISFRNRVCAGVVQEADHLLSLDDERLTFHPIRFDQTGMGSARAPTRIREIWFPGVHSDIGGGYPEDTAAMDPLVWMAQAASARGLRFDEAAIRRYARLRSPQAVIHDSRKGLAQAYRYLPRPKRAGPAHGGVQVVQGSVVRKMNHGFDGYAPLFLPGEVRVNEAPADWDRPEPMPLVHAAGAEAGVRLRVRRRLWNNRAQIGLAVAFVALPLLALAEVRGWGAARGVLAGWAGAWWQAVRMDFDALLGLYAPLRWYAGALVLAEVALIVRARRLGWSIKDHALRVWSARPGAGAEPGVADGAEGG
ncbi:MAG: DUF2235 domain-containing protein [Paracoccaceae bacterium]